MANAIGNLFVTPTAAGNLVGFTGSIPAVGSIVADGFIARTTATFTYWSSGATPNPSVGLWVGPGDVFVFGGNVSKFIACFQAAGAFAVEFTLGGS